jgi:hypothetical protein
MHIFKSLTLVTVAAVGAVASMPFALAAFSDVPADHGAYEAVTYLQDQGIVAGYDDGTFRPNQPVNRAEAMKFIIAPLVSADALGRYTTSGYADVPAGVWFLPYVEYGREQGVVDGPSTRPSFEGARPVLKAEFLKMLLLGNKVDPDSYGEIKLPLSDDVPSADAWFYPYLRYAITASMTQISQQGTLNPDRQLTRADTAILLHRFLMYREGRRTQALLSATENEILIVLNSLNENNIVQAEYASARALLAARGALASRTDNVVVQGALKVAESFRALVRGYRSGLNGDLDEAIRLAGDAWNLAAKAQEVNPDMADLVSKVQAAAQAMADSARTLQAGSP